MTPIYQLKDGRLVNRTNRAAKLEREHIGLGLGFQAFLMICTFLIGLYAGWSVH